MDQLNRKTGAGSAPAGAAEPVPPLREAWPALAPGLSGRRLALFLDFDGTLTPIVERPALARLSEAMRARVAALAARLPLAIVSGRDSVDVAARVGLAELVYAGCHGFDISGPGLPPMPAVVAPDMPDRLAAFGAALVEAVAEVPGVIVSIKRYAIAVHYRMVAAACVAGLEATVTALVEAQTDLRASRGKKVIEIRPDVDWHKGRAVLWLAEVFAGGGAPLTAIYIGDDITDEDGFRAVKDCGLGIVVADRPRPSAARYRLANPDEVGWFLDQLGAFLAAAKC